MKVLLVNHFPLTGSGSGVYTENIANYIVKDGHEVCVIMPENELVDSRKPYKVHPVYFDKDKFNFPCFTTHPRSNTTFYDLTDEEYQTYKNLFTKAIEEEINEFNPDVIHVGHIWTLSSIASNYDIPLVITAHGTDLIGYKECLKTKDEKYLNDAKNAFDKSSKIITISKDNSELVKEIFGDNDKTLMIPNGYNADVFYLDNYDKKSVLNEFNITNNYDKIVTFVGKFTEVKRINILLEAFSKLKTHNCGLVLAGSGSLIDEMKELAQNLNLNNVHFIGNQPHDKLRRLYNISDVSIVPSRNEAFGLVVIEALACGTPVIGSNSGGIPDIINDSVGELFELDNVDELASKMNEVLSNKKVYDREYLSNYAYNNYAQSIYIKDLVDIYANSFDKKIRRP